MEAKKSVSAQKQRETIKKKLHGKPFSKGNETAFKPGQSGNPGGLPKRTPMVSPSIQTKTAKWLSFP